MKTKFINGKWSVLLLCSIVMLLLTTPVWAIEPVKLLEEPVRVLEPVPVIEWACTHGHSGNIEYPGRVSTLERVHIGWGLDFQQSPGLNNWVHFAPPSSLGQQTRYIGLQFRTGSNDAFIDSVHVYDLGTKVKEFNDLGLSGDMQTEVLDLGSARTFTALGISVEVKAGVESSSHRILFTGACASQEP